MRHPTFPLAAAVAAALSVSQVAQVSAQERSMEQVIVTGSRTGLELRQLGSAVSVVSAENLQSGQILLTKEILQDIPGVQISTERPGAFTNVSIRGSDNDQVLVLLDGIELGDPSSTSTQFQFDHLSSGDIERIEVLRGNQSSLYGSDAIGGVINIITKKATADRLQFNAEAEAGSYGVRSINASILGAAGIVDYRLSANAYRADGPSLADPDVGPADEDDAYERRGLSGRLGVQLTPTLRAQLIGFLSDTEMDLDGTGQDATTTPFVGKDEAAYAAMLIHEGAGGRLRNELTYSYYEAERTYPGEFSLPGGDIYLGEKNNLRFTTSFDASDLISLAGGVDLEEETTDQLTSFSGSFVAGIDTDSLFGELVVTPSEALTLTGAIRSDDNSRFGTFDTYRFTAAYLLDGADRQIKLRASWGTGAKAPGLYQLFDPTYGNLALGVEESEGFDIGVDVRWAGGPTLELSYFHNDVENEIDFDFAQGGYIQRGETRSNGIEAALDTPLGDRLGWNITYTYLDARDKSLDAWLGRPRSTLSTSLRVQPFNDLNFTVRARYRDENASSGPGRNSDSFVVVDLLGSYRISDRLEIYGRVVNLFDEDYQMSWGRSTYDRSAFVGIRAGW